MANRFTLKKYFACISYFRINVDEIYNPEIHKLVIIVIDAWRWEFFIDSKHNNAMPKINELVNNKKACIYKTRVSIPTVTMPRIKVRNNFITFTKFIVINVVVFCLRL